MARQITYEIFILNITIDNVEFHSPEFYLELFNSAQQTHTTSVRENSYLTLDSEHDAMILGLVPIDEKEIDGIFARIIRFVRISADVPWFNVDSLEPANEQELINMNIPEGLRPHFKETYIYFDPKSHRLACRSCSGFGPKQMIKLIEKYLYPMQQRFGNITITIEQSKELLEQILSLEVLAQLKISINRPNPDDHGGYESQFAEELKNQQIERYVLDLKSDNNGRILPNEDTQKKMNIALSNGAVEAKGKNAGESMRYF
jgi:hypothetical protein